MTIVNNNPAFFRGIFSLLLAYVLLLALSTIYRFGSSPTDENLFAEPPSPLYTQDQIITTEGTAIPPFNLLLRAGGVKLQDTSDLEAVLKNSPPDVPVEIAVFVLAESRVLSGYVNREALKSISIRELPSTAHVIAITENGASDRAGMKVGDLIEQINGHTFRSIFAADSILRSGQTGKVLKYDVMRDNREITLDVTLASFGLPFPILVAILSGLATIGVGGVLGLKRPLIKAARLLGLLFLTQGYCVTVMLTRREFSLEGRLFFVNGTLVLCLSFLLPLILHTSLYFPKECARPIARRWPVIGGYLAGILTLAADLLPGQNGFPVMLAISGIYLLVVYIILRKDRTAEQKELSRPLRVAVLATAIIVSIFFGFLFFEGLAIAQHAGYIGLPLLLIPAAHLYVIGRHRLLDLDLRIRRGAQYTVVSSIWIAIILSLFTLAVRSLAAWTPELPNVQLTAGSVELVQEPMESGQRNQVGNVVIIGSALLLSVLLWRLGRAGMEFIGSRFHRTRYDYRKAATELTDVISTRLSMSALARGIVGKLAELMQLKRVGLIFFRDGRFCCCEEAYGFEESVWKDLCIRRESALAEAIQQFRGEIRIDYLPPVIKEEFLRLEFHYLIPIRSKDRLVGAILVGEKRSESTFQREDLDFLSAAARQASVAIENAFLYEELAGQERLKHELAIARRIQMESLPQSRPDVEGLDVDGISIPAMEVGGDYYDYLNGSAGRLTVVIGDVSGKGTSAALYMSKIQGILRSLNAFGLSPRELFTRTNTLLWNDLEKKSFVTASGALFLVRKREVFVSRAGHLPLYLYRQKKRDVEVVIPRGMGMGLSANGAFASELEERRIEFDPGDVFLFVTDGITEGKNEQGQEFGEEQLVACLRDQAHHPAREIRDSITEAVRGFTGAAPQHDDQTVVVVKIV